ncbi:MAG TPA: acetylxylan esterase [Dermatophilaceae bacterium]|nr:acetylxylan esterase [Dermatophilaceae bacterium]
MPLFDLASPQLEAHTTDVVAPEDLDAFWAGTVAQALGHRVPTSCLPVVSTLRLVDSFDVTLGGFDGHPVKAWYHRPAGVEARLPVVVQYQGYGGGRGLVTEVRAWVLAGWGCLEVDTRGQGSMWRPGHTPDPVGSDPSHPGFLTRGIRDPHDYYYRRAYTDAVLAARAARELPGADGRVVVSGGSQGGALAMAAAALADGVLGALIDVPFLCDIPRAADLTDDGPYAELTGYLAVHRDQHEAALRTLAYHDGAVLASRARCPALFSVGVMDQTCPPSTVYAAYNAYVGPKQIRAYRYNTHEGGGSYHEAHQLEWLTTLLG